MSIINSNPSPVNSIFNSVKVDADPLQEKARAFSDLPESKFTFSFSRVANTVRIGATTELTNPHGIDVHGVTVPNFSTLFKSRSVSRYLARGEVFCC